MSGIQPASTPVRPGKWVIFATFAYPEGYVREVFKTHGIAFKRLEGCWEGKKETSWIVHEDDWYDIQWLAEGETCVLVLDEQQPFRGAFQMNTHSGHKIWLGWFIETGKVYAEAQPAYTFDPAQWRWWTVEKAKPEPYIVKQRGIHPLQIDGTRMPG